LNAGPRALPAAKMHYKRDQAGVYRGFRTARNPNPHVALMGSPDGFDATLVHLARREGLSTVFTVDHADFNTYRIEGRKRFRIFPGIRQ